MKISLGLLDKEYTIASPGFNRWLVPPAALAIHLCIGMAYGFSVFWLPLSKALGIKDSIACGPDVGFFQELFIYQLRLENFNAGLDVHVIFCISGFIRGALGRLAGTCWSAQSGCH
jgi:hypothetical protein